MSEQYECSECHHILTLHRFTCPQCHKGELKRLRWTKGGDGSHWDGCDEVHWDCKISALEAEVKRLHDYAMRLLSDDTRIWVCECGMEFTSTIDGKQVIGDVHTATLCPKCEKLTARPKADVLHEENKRLRDALVKIANVYHTTDPECGCKIPIDGDGNIVDLSDLARTALEQK